MSVSAAPSLTSGGTLLFVGREPAPAAMREPLATLRASGHMVVSTRNARAASDDLARASTHAVLFLAEGPEDQVLAELEALASHGSPVLLIVPTLTPDLELVALRRGASECLGLMELDEGRLLSSVRRAAARAAFARRASERAELFRTLVERDSDGLVVLDHDLVIQYASEAGTQRLGLRREELTGHNAVEFIHPEDAARALENLARTIANPGTHVFDTIRLRHSDGSWHHFESTAISLLQDPVVHGVVVTFRDVTERQHEELARKTAEERFRELAEAAPVPMWLEDTQRRLIWENRTALAFVGVPWAEEEGYGWLETVHPEDRERVKAYYEATTAEQRSFTCEFRMRRHDGAYRHLLQIAIPRWGPDGAFAGFLGVDVDVSELQERKARHAEAEARYRQIAETVPVSVWMDDANHGLVFQNRTADEFSGRTLREEVGRAWYSEIHPDDRARVEASYAATAAQPVPYQHMYRLRRADGAYRWFIEIGVPRYGTSGELIGFIGVDVDVHELKTASEKLEEAETRYRNFIEHSTEGIWRFENETPIPIDLPEEQQIEQFLDHSHLAECNVAMAQMYGYERPEELVGKRLRQFVPPEDMAGLESYLRAFIRAGYRLTDAETHEHDRHGRSRYFLNNLVGVVQEGRLVHSWGTQRDITERRQLEEEARQARKMETAGRLAGGIAHDFNNLLTAILGTSEILLSELPERAPERADVEEIKRAATRAANLTRQLLAFSRRQVLQPRILDLTTVVQGVETMLRRLIGEHINLMTQTEPELWRVRADPGQLEQVIINLCVNARDAMPTGGTVLIEVDNYAFAGTTTGAESVMPAGDYVRLMVSDSGTGMDPETLRHLFEPFFTTKEPGKGTGLGLATVYGIVKQSGGFIYADSERGRGSRFRIYLPRVSGAADVLEAPGPAIPPPPAEGTLLLVEDEEAVRRLARRVLEGVGYRVLEASSGREALRLVEEWKGTLDLVVTDVIMPGMSGQELSARLREGRPWLRILYVSGYTDDAILQHGDLLPNTGFLQKPFTPGSLAQRVREVMGR